MNNNFVAVKENEDLDQSFAQDIVNTYECMPEEAEVSKLDSGAIEEFLEFLEKKQDYLKSGLGVFHTDNHSNW